MRIKNIIIFFFVILIIYISLLLPNVLVKALSNEIETRVFSRPENNSNVDVEAEKIYLVKAIHSIRSDNSKVTISPIDGENIIFESQNPCPDVFKELNTLKEYNILNNFDIENVNNFGVGLTNNTYFNKDRYVVHIVLANLDEIEFHLEIENKTGKIIYAYFSKNNFYDGDNEEVLRNFVRYLDLYIINDWKYSENLINQKYYLKSEKAKLAIVLDKSYEKYEISVKLNNF